MNLRDSYAQGSNRAMADFGFTKVADGWTGPLGTAKLLTLLASPAIPGAIAGGVTAGEDHRLSGALLGGATGALGGIAGGLAGGIGAQHASQHLPGDRGFSPKGTHLHERDINATLGGALLGGVGGSALAGGLSGKMLNDEDESRVLRALNEGGSRLRGAGRALAGE